MTADSPSPPRRPLGTYVEGGALVLAMLLGSAMLWVGFPLGWLWLGSHVGNSSQPSLLPYVVVIVGLAVSVVADYKLLVRLNDRYTRVMGVDRRTEIRAVWLRSMRDGRTRGITLTVLDRVMILTVAVAVCAFAIWFIGFAGSSVPA
jgi:hypothetical protein